MVAGGNGQLGKCLQKIAPTHETEYEFLFLGQEELDITNFEMVEQVFADFRPDFCINASAYTAVDLAEKESEKAFAVNADGVTNLAKACKKQNTVFIHVSTDYVFDGKTTTSYSEEDETNPIGIYGQSKRKGEELALELNPKTIVIRTSWLYSEFNKNFVKTMLNLFSQRDELGIVNDQFGQPTNANDLAEAIMLIIQSDKKTYGIFHFSNYPETTWFLFAKKIAEFVHSSVKLNPITTAEFPTPAKRPVRSTMSLQKIENNYQVQPKNWESSLEECIQILNTPA